MITMAATISRVPMGITVAKMIMVVVESPLLPPPLLLLPPLVVIELDVTVMPAIVVPLARTVLRLFSAVMAKLELGALGDDTSMLGMTEPVVMFSTIIFWMVTFAALAMILRKLR